MKRKILFTFILFSMANLHIFAFSADFFANIGLISSLNTYKNSAPSPIMFSLGGGTNIKFTPLFSFSPQLQFFINYWLYDENENYIFPAEIEHRTALALNCLVDLPIIFNFYARKSTFSAGVGLAFLLRYGFLSQGVTQSEQEDIKKINSLFYEKCNFLLPSVSFAWLYELNNGWKAGPEIKALLSLGGLLHENSPSPLQNSMLSVAFKIEFPKFK